MTIRNTFKLSSLILALGAALTLSACGGGSSDGKVELPPRKNGNRITISNNAEPDTLDPTKSSAVATSDIVRQAFMGLVSNDTTGKTVPGLAESWDNEEDKVWTFHLRKDAKWSNGDPITAHDFVYSLRRLSDPAVGAPFGSYLEDARVVNAKEIMLGEKPADTLGVKALDDYTLQITLLEPVPYFADMLTQVHTYAVPQKVIEKYGDKWTQPENYVVSGPYKLKEWVVNGHITLEKNPTFYDADKVKIQEITFLSSNAGNNEFNRYKAGEIDIAYVPSDQVKTADEQFGDQVKRIDHLCTFWFEPNTAKPPFDNPKVRTALKYLVDRDQLVKVTGKGETPAYRLNPLGANNISPDAQPEWKSWDANKRIEEAKKLLAEAGYSDFNPLTFELLYSTSESGKRFAAAISSIWQQAVPFIKTSLNNQEWKTFLDTKRLGNYQLAYAGWCADYNEPANFLVLGKSTNPNNTNGYKNKDYDALMDSTLKPGVTTEDRAKIYAQAEAVLDRDSVYMPLYYTVYLKLVRPEVLNFTTTDPLDQYHVSDWELKQ